MASKRLLALLGDDRLVDEIRRGNEAAFAVVYERHSPGLLSFCRHMLGSRESGEEALQHAFVAAWADLQRNERPVKLKPWLYTIARNRCLSLLRARHLETSELDDPPATDGLAEEVGRRADLRALVADLRDLSEEQRAALVLSELGGFSHADIADVLGCRTSDVKGIVFRARSTLVDWRAARETPCEEIREQLAELTGGALRRRPLRRHLDACPDCREFNDELRAQRRMMAAILPVVPTLGLKQGVFAAVGVGGGTAGGAVVAGAGAAGAGFLGSTVAKVAVVAVAVGGATAGGERLLDRSDRRSTPASPAAAPSGGLAHPPAAPLQRPGSSDTSHGARAETPAKEKRGKRGRSHGGERSSGRGASGLAPPTPPVRARGTPPALGRVKQGKPPPPAGAGNGRRVAKEKKPARVRANPVGPKPPKAPKDKIRAGDQTRSNEKRTKLPDDPAA